MPNEASKHPIIAMGDFRDAVRELAASFPEHLREIFPSLLRDLADDIDDDARFAIEFAEWLEDCAKPRRAASSQLALFTGAS